MKRYKIDVTNVTTYPLNPKILYFKTGVNQLMYDLEEENIPKDQYLAILKHFNHNLDDDMPIGIGSLDNMPVGCIVTRIK